MEILLITCLQQVHPYASVTALALLASAAVLRRIIPEVSAFVHPALSSRAATHLNLENHIADM